MALNLNQPVGTILTALETRTTAAENATAAKDATITARNNTISMLNSTVSTQAISITSKDAAIAERDATIASLQGQIAGGAGTPGAMPLAIVSNDMKIFDLVFRCPNPFNGQGAWSIIGTLPPTLTFKNGDFRRTVQGVTDNRQTAVTARLTFGDQVVDYACRFIELAVINTVWGDLPNLIQNLSTPIGHDITVLPGARTTNWHLRTVGPINTSIYCNFNVSENSGVEQKSGRAVFWPNNDGRISEVIIPLNTNMTAGQTCQLRVNVTGIIYGYQGDNALTYNTFYTVTCAASLGGYVEPVAVQQVDPKTRVKGKAGRDMVYALPIAPAFIDRDWGTPNGGPGGVPQISTGSGELNAPVELGIIGSTSNGAQPVTVMDERIRLMSERKHVTARSNPAITSEYSSPQIHWRQAFEFFRGYLEVDICAGRLNRGIVPAVWLLGGWVFLNSEYDMGEWNLQAEGVWTATSHFVASYATDRLVYSGYGSAYKSFVSSNPTTPKQQFNVGELWKSAFDWSVDEFGQEWATILWGDEVVYQQRGEAIGVHVPQNGFTQRQPLYPICQIQTGGSLIGNRDISNEVFPAWFYVEDVRAYQSSSERAGDAAIKAALNSSPPFHPEIPAYTPAYYNSVVTPPVRQFHVYPYDDNPTSAQTGLALALKARPAYRSGPFSAQLTSGALLAGLSVNPVTGWITGVPTQGGNLDATVTYTDGGTGQTKSVRYQVAVTVAFKPSDLSASILALDMTSLSDMTVDTNGKVLTLAKAGGSSVTAVQVVGSATYNAARKRVICPADGQSGFDTKITVPATGFTLAMLAESGYGNWIADISGGQFFSQRIVDQFSDLVWAGGEVARMDCGTYDPTRIVVWTYDGTTLVGRCNGVERFREARAVTIAAQTINLGRGFHPNYGSQTIDLGFFYARGTSSSDADVKKIEGAIAWKGGSQAYLPTGHPYKNGAP